MTDLQKDGVTQPAILRGNRAIEDAAIDWVMELERRTGRSPVDQRYTAAFPGDILSHPYVIEVKAIGGSARGFGLPLEQSQVESAATNPDFVLDVVENVAQGDSTKFVHHRFAGSQLTRLLEKKKPRTYFEVPLPASEYDAAPSHPSLSNGPVATPDVRPAWALAVGATRISITRLPGAGGDIAIATARVEFARALGPKLTWQETYGKTPIVGLAGPQSCAEVELVVALRNAGWSAWWIDTFGQAPARWQEFITVPASLPEPVRSAFLAIDEAVARNGSAKGGRWDIVATNQAETLYLESKGAGDSIRPSQVAWLGAALTLGVPATAFGIANYVVRP